MVVDRAKLSSSEPRAVVESSPPPATPASVDAVLLGTNADTKLLLRGLLRLYHHTVVLDGRAAEDLEGLPPAPGPRILLLDAESVTGGWESALRLALRSQPGIRPILLTMDRSPDLAARARAAGVRVVLVRPFAIAELLRALASAGEDS
jgi:CheY-like chemotaxis protein